MAFTNVAVVPMDADRVLPNRTVVVSGERISWLGPAEEAEVDPDALVVDGRGMYLMPGLADMHVHTWREVDQLLYVANGVTTVRNMWGTETQLGIRSRIESGDLVGPTIHTSGPLIDGTPAFWEGSRIVTSPDDARQVVRDQKARGYEFIKAYNRLTVPVYEALIDEASLQDIPVAGHVPIAVGLEAVIGGPQISVEHLNRYSTLLQSSPPDSADKFLGESGWLTADRSLMPVLAERLAADGMWTVPTLVLRERGGMTPSERTAFLSGPDVKHVHPALRRQWLDSALPAQSADVIRRGQPARRDMVRALRDSGARLLLGTDVGNPFLIPGAAAHGELSALVEAGLTPYEALHTGTAAPATYFGREGEFGVVAAGARADLILVTGNPLVDVANARRRAGVMVRGQWYTEAELGRMLDQQTARFD